MRRVLGSRSGQQGVLTAACGRNAGHSQRLYATATGKSDTSNSAVSGRKWDAIVVGGGHNGLVTAAYLAKAGKKVAVLERRHLVGGAAVTEELLPGYKFSRASYLCSLFRPQIFKDLKLKEKYGVKLYHRNPSSFTPLLDGRYLLMGGGTMEETQRAIAQFSKADAEAYPEYEAMLDKLVKFINPLIDEIPPNLGESPFSGSPKQMLDKLSSLSRLGLRTAKLGKDIAPLYEIVTAPAAQILNKWFESEPLKSTLATDAIIGAMTSPQVPGSGYVLLHHVMGETDGIPGAWSYVEGGMGALSRAIASAAADEGVTIVTDAAVKSIIVSDRGASGVELVDGTKLESDLVISNTTPEVTFHSLLSPDAQARLPSDFRQQLKHYDYTSPVMKINIALNQIPNFTCLPNQAPGVVSPHHRCTIHLGAESMADIETAYQDALQGTPSRKPVIEMTIPSSLDPTLAPKGHHVSSLFVQYAPYHIRGGAWDDKTKEEYADRVFSLIDQYAPGFKESIIYKDILAPPDLERVFGLTGGNIFHGAMGLNQLFFMRPSSGFARYQTPIPGLYLCGSGAHPGGGVMGAAGQNCARAILNA